MNPFLQRLGYSETDRVVVLHADDIGMCQSTIPAIDNLFNAGIISSAAVMVPCPWFPAAAEYARRTPQADLGVHTTLTCEWNSFRWGPLSTRDSSSGLMDREGYFPRSTAELWAQVDEPAFKAEIRTQIEQALMAGIDMTHIDSHMGTAFEPRLLGAYLAMAKEYGVPAFLPRMNTDLAQQRGLSAEQTDMIMHTQALLEANGTPLFDNMGFMPLDQHQERVAEAKRQLSQLPPGLTYFICHPSVDSPELRAIAADWQARVADYEAFTSVELADFIRNSGIHVVGMRALKQAMQ